MTKAEGLKPLLSRHYLASVLGYSPDDLDRFAERAPLLHTPFTQRKPNGKERKIDNPAKPLKAIQTRIKTRLLARVPLPEVMFGGIRGRSTRENAMPHVRRAEVVTVDIADFFPSISADRVFRMWVRVFGASHRVAKLLTALTTHDGHLSQGSPSSTGIANLVAVPLVLDLEALCKRHGLGFSIFVDDITNSGHAAHRALPEVIAAIKSHGFCVRSRKVRIMPSSMPQKVTGITVNRKVSNGRERLRAIREDVRTVLRGPAAEKDYQRIHGKIAHATAICRPQGERLLRTMQAAGSAPSTAGLEAGAGS